MHRRDLSPQGYLGAIGALLAGFARKAANGPAAFRKADCLYGRSVEILRLLKDRLAGVPRLEVERVLGQCPRAAAPGPRLGLLNDALRLLGYRDCAPAQAAMLESCSLTDRFAVFTRQ
ncbi:hypothetical protein AYJ54_24245 [Bradyrhizobium centrolobii]|uniref:Uncharacterized protein n=2 Tax=Bradyrhizobium TaxID=374 RepID=A0A176YL20_9BRAD|nr:hypothetical protein AYJ54_24245 [Bradyrhizobium centrolobii]OAF07704.1 hypothetical protein AXW67_29565 [Bradyrhizobium neotropicale]